MAEYYIRREGDEDASGPFDLDQLASLTELGKLDDTAFYYDMEEEKWRPISDSAEAMEAMYPKKQKLSLKAEADAKAAEETTSQEQDASQGERATTENAESPGEPVNETQEKSPPKLKKKEANKPKPIVVTEMLAQAEGREGDDPSGKSPLEKRAAIAYLGLIAALAFLLVSAVAMALVKWDLVLTANAPEMARSPYLIVAAVDIALAVFLILQVTEIYPLVRFRAALGLGFISILFLASGDWKLAAGNALICAAVYFATAVGRLPVALAAIAVGLSGVALYAMDLAPNVLK